MRLPESTVDCQYVRKKGTVFEYGVMARDWNGIVKYHAMGTAETFDAAVAANEMVTIMPQSTKWQPHAKPRKRG